MAGSGFFINQDSDQPIYYQLYLYYIDLIRTGQIKVGEKLPGKRSAAARFGISVNTVVSAYQMLVAEGYISAKERSGYTVNKLSGIYLPSAPSVLGEEIAENHSTGEQTEKAAEKKLSFSTRGIDLELFPLKTWTRLQKEILSGGENLFSSGSWQGEEALRSSISNYLNDYRGANCHSSRIVIGAGLEVLIGMLSRLFPQSVFGLENPGYRQMGTVLANNGVKVCHIDVDKGGMRADLLEKSAANLVYLTPSHQFPTGAVMPVGRRMEMLNWAHGTGHYIIEDDYDSEFRFSGRPLPCLQGLDTGDKVIYAGTFSRSLAPGLRVAYLVLPPALMKKWLKAYGSYSCTVSRPEQQCLARFISRGHFSRGINRARLSYKEKRNILIDEITNTFNNFQIINEHTGLYLILRLEGKNALRISGEAAKLGLLLRPLSAYRHEKNNGAFSPPIEERGCLLLGYGGLKIEDIPLAVGILSRAAALV